MPGEAKNRLEAMLALVEGGCLAGPFDNRWCTDPCFFALCSKACEVAQMVFRNLERVTRSSAQCQILVYLFHQHGSTSGQGWTTCLRSAMSTLA
jgi:hypothetical protein